MPATYVVLSQGLGGPAASSTARLCKKIRQLPFCDQLQPTAVPVSARQPVQSITAKGLNAGLTAAERGAGKGGCGTRPVGDARGSIAQGHRCHALQACRSLKVCRRRGVGQAATEQGG